MSNNFRGGEEKLKFCFYIKQKNNFINLFINFLKMY